MFRTYSRPRSALSGFLYKVLADDAVIFYCIRFQVVSELTNAIIAAKRLQQNRFSRLCLELFIAIFANHDCPQNTELIMF